MLAAVLLVPTLVAACLIGASATSGAAEHLQQGLDTHAIDTFVREQLAAGHLPGAANAITRGAEVLHIGMYGHDSSGAPITQNTPFRIASLSKSFTSLAVMQLVEQQKVRLDQRVRTAE